MQDDKWKRVALFMLSCHAGTLEHECQLKSYPKGFKNRMARIALWAKDLVDEAGPWQYPRKQDSEEWVMQRFNDAVEKIEVDKQ